MSPRLSRAGYRRYVIAEGPAEGTVIEAACNPRALPCYRWVVVDGEVGWGSTRGHTRSSLVAECVRQASELVD